MAEWPFTEFFQAGKSAPRNRCAYLITPFDQSHSLLAHKPDTVENSHKSQKDKKANSKQYFGSEQLPNKIHLKKQNDRKQEGQTLSQLGLFSCDESDLLSASEY